MPGISFALPVTVLGLEQGVLKVNPDFTATRSERSSTEGADRESYLSHSQHSQPKAHHLLLVADVSWQRGCSTMEPAASSWEVLCSLLGKSRFSGCFSNRENRSCKLCFFFRSKFSNFGIQSLEDTLEKSHNGRKCILRSTSFAICLFKVVSLWILGKKNPLCSINGIMF